MDTHVQTDATSIFGKTIETLNNLNGRPPEWYEVIAMLNEKTEKGSYASIISAFETYSENTNIIRISDRKPELSIVKTLDRVKPTDISMSPMTELEQLIVSKYPNTDLYYEHCYISYDKSGKKNVRKETVKAEDEVFLPGRYSIVSFRYSKRQRNEMRKLCNALENYADEIQKFIMNFMNRYSDASAPIPEFHITAVPLLYGGKCGVTFAGPHSWETDEDGEDSVVRILFESADVHFTYDRNVDPEETFKMCKSELASEWIREEQHHRIDEEEKAYKKKRDEEISQYLENSRVKQHTFETKKKPGDKSWESTH